MNKKLIPILLVAFFSVSGCSVIPETFKVLWGSSTRALENARVDALKQSFKCNFNDCFDAVLSLSREGIVYPKSQGELENISEEENNSSGDRKVFQVFIKNRKKKHIVVMGIAGNVNTTEVGIFFTQPNSRTVTLEISSLSSSAKRKVADLVFSELSTQYTISK